jgi:hypothetical protein
MAVDAPASPEYFTTTRVFRTPKTNDLPSRPTGILSCHFLVPMNFCNWLSFQYVVSFVLRKSPFLTLCFQ